MIPESFSAAAERNTLPLLAVLRYELEDRRSILEIGSGTGQHAVAFARALPHFTWQTSDLEANHPAISARLENAGLRNVRKPLIVDVSSADLPARSYDAVFSSNTAHIMGIAAVRSMFTLASKVLCAGGVFCLYGPFREGGKFNTQSNAAFHFSLQRQNPEMGIRDLERLDRLGKTVDLLRKRRYAMPANNFLIVWHKA